MVVFAPCLSCLTALHVASRNRAVFTFQAREGALPKAESNQNGGRAGCREFTDALTQASRPSVTIR